MLVLQCPFRNNAKFHATLLSANRENSLSLRWRGSDTFCSSNCDFRPGWADAGRNGRRSGFTALTTRCRRSSERMILTDRITDGIVYEIHFADSEKPRVEPASSRETDATPRWNAVVSGDLYLSPRASCCNIPEKSVYPGLLINSSRLIPLRSVVWRLNFSMREEGFLFTLWHLRCAISSCVCRVRNREEYDRRYGSQGLIESLKRSIDVASTNANARSWSITADYLSKTRLHLFR